MAKSATTFLLMVVLVATTCASGADAQFTITDLCNKTITLSTAAGNTTLLPGVVQTIQGLPATLFGTGLVNLTTLQDTTGLPSTIPVPTEIVSILDALISLKKLEITCNGPCITLTATVTIARAPVVLTLGLICPPNVLPPSPTPAPSPQLMPSN